MRSSARSQQGKPRVQTTRTSTAKVPYCAAMAGGGGHGARSTLTGSATSYLAGFLNNGKLIVGVEDLVSSDGTWGQPWSRA